MEAFLDRDCKVKLEVVMMKFFSLAARYFTMAHYLPQRNYAGIFPLFSKAFSFMTIGG